MNSVIVTGGSSGIGAATVRAFANEGWNVGFTWRTGRERAQRLESEISALGVTCESRSVDLTDSDATRSVVGELMSALPDVTVLVNNAGVNRRQAFLTEDAEGWRHTFDVNAFAPLVTAQVVAQRWIHNRVAGRVVNVTSVLDRVPLTGGSAYCASKAALRSLTQVMALELAEHDITVIGVAPGETITPMNFDELPPAGERIERPVIALGRAMEAREIAGAIFDLCGPNFGYMTGDTVLIDGGLALRSGPDSMQRTIGEPPSA